MKGGKDMIIPSNFAFGALSKVQYLMYVDSHASTELPQNF